ncbi:uncharacterized protein LOC125061626 [Pieris napi]|uniref:uncharacterized protein LOC125061626 n=1 Tax=Pieris napi TaxID=78633 RepID=UPI001FB917AB|nr:uncharacterized protein LOC125061626 [Pieris napi]
MARTKASVGAKVSMGKSSKARCSAAPPPSNSSSSGERSSRSYSGGNPVCPRDIPKWQKPITTFIFTKEKKIIEDSDAGSSKSKLKRQIIYSDEESDSEIKNNNGDMKNEVDRSDNTNEIEDVESQVLEGEVKESIGEENVDNKSELVESQIYGESQDYDLIESPPKNRELDESIILEPLTGECSHKLEEYYPKTAKKSKGVSKIINKENFNNKVKRNLDDAYEESPNKKMRIE